MFTIKTIKIISLTLVLSLTGCKGLLPKPKFDANDPNSSVVFGYIGIKNMPSEFGWVKIKGLGGEDDYVTASTYKGAFWHVAVRPGHRYVPSFGGFSGHNIFGQGDEANVYNFNKNDRKSLAIKIKKPGVHFMGSYRFSMSKDKFITQRIKSPSEKKVLKMVLAGLKKESGERFYMRQIKMIEKRLAKLQ